MKRSSRVGGGGRHELGQGDAAKRTPASPRRGRLGLVVALAGLGLGTAVDTPAQTDVRRASTRPQVASVVEDRWKESLDAFAAADKAQPPRPGGVLFVGSSSIRLWSDLETQFGATAVVKRGFGGSRLADCARYVDRLVLPYAPRQVIVYAGDNDLAEGSTPEQVLASFSEFVERVRDSLPETRIAYVSIKPSPLRATLMPQAIETNRMIERYTRSVPNLDYIDIYSKMLDAEGRPRADLFQADALHLNPAGYAVWRAEIAAHLQPAGAPPRGP